MNSCLQVHVCVHTERQVKNSDIGKNLDTGKNLDMCIYMD